MNLKPCPFCGGPVKLEQTIDGRKWWGVVCRNTIGHGGTCAVQIIPSASEEAAVARWNRRTPADEQTSSIATQDMISVPRTELEWALLGLEAAKELADKSNENALSYGFGVIATDLRAQLASCRVAVQLGRDMT